VQKTLWIGLDSRETHRNAGFIHRHEYLGDESPKAAAASFSVYISVLAALDRHNKHSACLWGAVSLSTEWHMIIL